MLVNTSPAYSHNLGYGQVLYTNSAYVQRVQTPDLSVVLERAGTEGDLRNRIVLKRRNSALTKVYEFELPVPLYPQLYTYNFKHYCDQEIVFITLRYPSPRYADGRVRFLETHSFLFQSLEYLDTVGASYDAIGPLEAGVDLGFEYTMPHPYIIHCSASEDGFELTFRDHAPQYDQ